MALPRGLAQLGSDLRLGILFRWDGAPTDPLQVRLVEIIATDGSTVLATLDSIEHEPGSGEYYVTVPGELLTTVGRHLDRWYYTWVEGEGEQSAFQDFYVHQSVSLRHYGPDLQAGQRYLKAFPPLAPGSQDGITQADLDAAMNAADSLVDSLFGSDYDMAAWRESPPPLVSILWELLASARAIRFRELRLGLPGGEADSTAARLERSARDLVDRILHGWPERLHLRDAAGRILRPRKNRSVTTPRARTATSDFF